MTPSTLRRIQRIYGRLRIALVFIVLLLLWAALC